MEAAALFKDKQMPIAQSPV